MVVVPNFCYGRIHEPSKRICGFGMGSHLKLSRVDYVIQQQCLKQSVSQLRVRDEQRFGRRRMSDNERLSRDGTWNGGWN